MTSSVSLSSPLCDHMEFATLSNSRISAICIRSVQISRPPELDSLQYPVICIFKKFSGDSAAHYSLRVAPLKNY